MTNQSAAAKHRPDYDKLETVLVEVKDHVATVSLNVPETGNAMNGTMHEELAEAFYLVNGDQDVYAVVVTGAGDAFCGGGDPNYIRDLQPHEYDEVFLTVRRLVNNIVDLDKPLVAALNGPTVGVGATVAVNSDIVIAHEGVEIADTHVKGGLVAGDGGALMWALNTSFPVARYHLLTGEPLSAKRAYEFGLVNELVPADQVKARAHEIAQQLADGPGAAIRGTKRVFAKIADVIGAGVFELAGELERISLYSEDHKEALAAAGEGRPPAYRHR